ncbi:MAG: hypothetical protein EOP32_25685 [Rhodococcus sp. (in: high G+C Gram-positive bacteria)]|nr:MAG: hypothetical protein EOP32_25685 [Rhodococcus sp. (in: high G+C Gram-positive bacteria)]
MLRGSNVMRIVWLPGSDLLEGECHCGARHVAEEPAALWEWLLAHPEGHRAVNPHGHRPVDPPATAAPLPAAPESAPVPV